MTRLAAHESPLGTLAQSLAQARLLLRSMEPTWFLDSLRRLDATFVARHGIRGLIWDIDGTLTGYHHTELHPEVADSFAALLTLAELRHAILSNAPEWRTRELARMFPTIPVIRGYALDGDVIGRRLQGETEVWMPAPPRKEWADRAIPLRKPNAALVRLAIEELACQPAATVMIGDQHLTDIAGANLAGVRSIKVRNPARGTFPLAIRISQRAEAVLYRLSRRPFTTLRGTR